MTKKKNPTRVNMNQRLTGWNIDEYQEKEKILKDVIKKCLNANGFDSAFNIPDYILSNHMVAALWAFAKSTSDLAFHEGRVELSDIKTSRKFRDFIVNHENDPSQFGCCDDEEKEE